MFLHLQEATCLYLRCHSVGVPGRKRRGLSTHHCGQLVRHVWIRHRFPRRVPVEKSSQVRYTGAAAKRWGISGIDRIYKASSNRWDIFQVETIAGIVQARSKYLDIEG